MLGERLIFLNQLLSRLELSVYCKTGPYVNHLWFIAYKNIYSNESLVSHTKAVKNSQTNAVKK